MRDNLPLDQFSPDIHSQGITSNPRTNFSFCQQQFFLETAMSFKPPKPPQASSQSYTQSRRPSISKGATLHDHCLVPSSEATKPRRGYGTKGRVHLRKNEVLTEPFGQIFVQQPTLPLRSTAAAVHPPALDADDRFVDACDIEPYPIYISGEVPDSELRQQRSRRKKERQWAKWENETIPLLLQPYLRILRQSDNLRTLTRHSDITLPTCSCKRRTSINVTCVFFERKFYFQYF